MQLVTVEEWRYRSGSDWTHKSTLCYLENPAHDQINQQLNKQAPGGKRVVTSDTWTTGTVTLSITSHPGQVDCSESLASWIETTFMKSEGILEQNPALQAHRLYFITSPREGQAIGYISPGEQDIDTQIICYLYSFALARQAVREYKPVCEEIQGELDFFKESCSQYLRIVLPGVLLHSTCSTALYSTGSVIETRHWRYSLSNKCQRPSLLLRFCPLIPLVQHLNWMTETFICYVDRPFRELWRLGTSLCLEYAFIFYTPPSKVWLWLYFSFPLTCHQMPWLCD